MRWRRRPARLTDMVVHRSGSGVLWVIQRARRRRRARVCTVSNAFADFAEFFFCVCVSVGVCCCCMLFYAVGVVDAVEAVAFFCWRWRLPAGEQKFAICIE